MLDRKARWGAIPPRQQILTFHLLHVELMPPRSLNKMTTLGKLTTVLFGINSVASVDVSLNDRVRPECSHSVVDLMNLAIGSRRIGYEQDPLHRKLMGSNIVRNTSIIDPYSVELSFHPNARPKIDAPSKFPPPAMNRDVIVNDREAIQGLPILDRLTVDIHGFLTWNERLGKTSYAWRDAFRALHSVSSSISLPNVMRWHRPANGRR